MSKNKYASLISNTVVFGISSFGSKVLTFLLSILITHILDPNIVGRANYITAICNFILPIMYLCMGEAIIRFGMDSHYKRADVFSVAVFTVLSGYVVLLFCYPAFGISPDLQGYQWLIYLYCLASAMRTVTTNFVRASGLVRIFALDGVVTTITTILFSLLFLLRLDMGIEGYILGTVTADALSTLSLFLLLRLHRFLRVRGVDRGTAYDMIIYSLPLVPTALAWWFINLSDQFFIRRMIDEYTQGIYSQASHFPGMLTIVSTFFTRAWELSAFSEFGSKEGQQFFSTVFRSYYTLIFISTSGLVLLIKPLTNLFGESYYIAWRYSLFLLLAVAFSCLVTFLGTIYNAVKKNLMVLITAAIGAFVNFGLNFVLIWTMGAEGAAVATFISFFVIFLIRFVDTRRYMRLDAKPLLLLLSTALLIIQAMVGMLEVRLWVLWECLLLLALLLLNSRQLSFLIRQGLSMLRNRGKASG